MKITRSLSLAAAMAVSIAASTASAQVVISAVYGGGGGSTANAHLRDYIELLNTGTSAVTLTGSSLQYASAAGNYNAAYAFPAATSIGAKKYLLVITGTAGTSSPSTPLPTADLDAAAALNISATSGKVALVNQTAALATNPALPNAAIIDAVAFGAATVAEGGTAANNGVAIDALKVAVRNNLGQTDTNNNNADFTIIANTTFTPRNSSSTAVPVAVSAFTAE